jgi:hypothetical protein
MTPESGHLNRALTAIEPFTFGFGTMVGIGRVVPIDALLHNRGTPWASGSSLAGTAVRDSD